MIFWYWLVRFDWTEFEREGLWPVLRYSFDISLGLPRRITNILSGNVPAWIRTSHSRCIVLEAAVATWSEYCWVAYRFRNPQPHVVCSTWYRARHWTLISLSRVIFKEGSVIILLLQALSFLYSLKVLAFSTTHFHFPRSWTQVIQFLTSICQMSCLTLSAHWYLGFPRDLLVRGFHLNIFLTVLVSGILSTWPNQLRLWTLIWLSILLCFISLSNSSLVLILHIWFSFVCPSILLKIFLSKMKNFLIMSSFSTHVSEAYERHNYHLIL